MEQATNPSQLLLLDLEILLGLLSPFFDEVNVRLCAMIHQCCDIAGGELHKGLKFVLR